MRQCASCEKQRSGNSVDPTRSRVCTWPCSCWPPSTAIGLQPNPGVGKRRAPGAGLHSRATPAPATTMASGGGCAPRASDRALLVRLSQSRLGLCGRTRAARRVTAAASTGNRGGDESSSSASSAAGGGAGRPRDEHWLRRREGAPVDLPLALVDAIGGLELDHGASEELFAQRLAQRSFALIEDAVCPRRIQRKLRASETPEACLEVASLYHVFLDDVHAATAYGRVAELALRARAPGAEAARLVSDERFVALGGLVKQRLHTMGPRSLSTVANACAKLRHADCDVILSCIRTKVTASPWRFSPLDIENVLWAHAKLRLGLPGPEVDLWLAEIARRPTHLTSKAAVNLLYACQRLTHPPPPDVLDMLLAALRPDAMRLIDLINALSSLAHLADRLATPRGHSALSAVLGGIEERLEAGSEDAYVSLLNLGNLVWSLSRMPHLASPRLLASVDALLCVRAQHSTREQARTLTTVLLAFHRFGWLPSQQTVAALEPLVWAALGMSPSPRGGAGGLRARAKLLRACALLDLEVPSATLGEIETMVMLTSDNKVFSDVARSFGRLRYVPGEGFKAREAALFSGGMGE